MTIMTETQWEGRKEQWNSQDDDARNYYDVDYARIIHSASFRRLQGKTQILNLGDSDFYRTRLTHSLEVSQIGMGIVEQLRRKYKDDADWCVAIDHLPHLKLIAAIGATHDLGHPPFGHGGEVALNYCMRDDGGFEGNAQTLRILTKLEGFSNKAGANLSRRTLLGCLKYPQCFSKLKNWGNKAKKLPSSGILEFVDRKSCKPPKCYFDDEREIVDWILNPLSPKDKSKFTKFEKTWDKDKHHKTKHQSFDCSIMNLADDISDAVHDFEDVLSLKLIGKQTIDKQIGETGFAHFISTLRDRYGDENKDYDTLVKNLLGSKEERKWYIGRLVHYFLTHLEFMKEDFSEPLLKYRVNLESNAQELLDLLKKLVREEIIFSPNVQQLEFKGQRMVVEVFEILNSEPEKFLPLEFRERFKANPKKRVICDYIAGMTDAYLLKTYERLCSPRMGSVFYHL